MAGFRRGARQSDRNQWNGARKRRHYGQVRTQRWHGLICISQERRPMYGPIGLAVGFTVVFSSVTHRVQGQGPNRRLPSLSVLSSPSSSSSSSFSFFSFLLALFLSSSFFCCCSEDEGQKCGSTCRRRRRHKQLTRSTEHCLPSFSTEFLLTASYRV